VIAVYYFILQGQPSLSPLLAILSKARKINHINCLYKELPYPCINCTSLLYIIALSISYPPLDFECHPWWGVSSLLLMQSIQCVNQLGCQFLVFFILKDHPMPSHHQWQVRWYGKFLLSLYCTTYDLQMTSISLLINKIVQAHCICIIDQPPESVLVNIVHEEVYVLLMNEITGICSLRGCLLLFIFYSQARDAVILCMC